MRQGRKYGNGYHYRRHQGKSFGVGQGAEKFTFGSLHREYRQEADDGGSYRCDDR